MPVFKGSMLLLFAKNDKKERKQILARICVRMRLKERRIPDPEMCVTA